MNRIEDIIKNNGFIIYHVKGTSMLPLLDGNKDLVKICKIDKPLNKYDVVLFKRDNKYVLHRIIDIKKDIYYVIGDNQIEIEEVKYSQIIGICTGKIYKKKFIPFGDKQYIEYVNRICKDISSRKKIYSIDGTINEYNDLLNLTISAINNQKYIIQGNQDMVLKLAIDQKIACFLFNALDKENTIKDIYDLWQKHYYDAIKKDVLYKTNRDKLYKEFNNKKIDFLPLKGIIIKDYYPVSYTRQFVDNDILFDLNRFEDVCNIFKHNGYELILPINDNVNTFKKDDLLSFEMHNYLFEETYPIFRNYFLNILNKSKTINNSYEHKMNDLDFYLYFLVHMYKHYYGSGIGLRFYIDLYYINKSILNNIDKEKLNEELIKLNIKDFYDDTMKFLNELLMSDYSDKEKISYILDNRLYGSRDNYIQNKINQKGKLSYIFTRLFPPIYKMDGRYPILKKIKLLLPIFWLIRLIENLFSKNHRLNFIVESKIVKKYQNKDN